MQFNCAITGVGSLPETDAQKAVETVLKNFPEIPFWPQLPKKDFREEMYFQYIEGFPGLVFSEMEKKAFFTEKNLALELEKFYEQMLSENPPELAISPAFASGLWEFQKQKEQIKKLAPKFIKGQIIGPVSLGLALTVDQAKPLFYHETLMEAVLIALKAKLNWQINFLKQIFSEIIISIDEPYLASFGSGVIHLPQDKVKSALREIATEIKAQGALAGIHCCGNTDWGMIFELGFDLINFDAFNYGDKFLLYHAALKTFLEKGGSLAWGIVPTSGETEIKNAELLSRMKNLLDYLNLKALPPNLILSASLLTPSCGMGSLSQAKSQQVIKDLRAVSTALKLELES